MKIKNDKIIVHVICLIAAIGFWAVVMIGKNPLNSKYFYKVPVTIKDIDVLKKGDVEYVLMEGKDGFTVDVKVTGLNNDLSKLEAKDIKATATMLSNFSEGINSLLVTVEAINDMKAEVISSKYIKCNIEQVVNVEVNVSVKSTGALAEGYYIHRKYSNPDSIFVRGPRSIVNSVSKVEAVLDIDKKTETITQNRPVKLYDNTDKEIDISLITLSQNSVDVVYDIYPTKTVPINVIINGSPAEEYRVTEIKPAIGTIKIAAPKEILSKVTDIETEPIDVTGLESHVVGYYKLKVPSGVVLTDNPDSLNVIVVIEKVEEKEFVYDYTEIKYINKADNLIVSIPDSEEPKQVIVKVRAVESVLNAISKENIELIADLTDAVEGVLDTNLSINLTSANLIVESITSDTEMIRINLEAIEVSE